MTKEILRAANFTDCIMEHRVDRPQNIIRGYKTIGLAEGIQVFQQDDEQSLCRLQR